MHLCGICLQGVEAPASLPCGHIFCSECLSRAVDAIKQYSSLHCCPACRSRYSVANSDANISSSNSHRAIPSIRRLYLDQPTTLPGPSSSVTEVTRENRRLQAEISALHTNCEMWRKRAEAHGAATLKLLTLLRITRDEASQVQRQVKQSNEPVRQYDVLKRRFEEDEPSQTYPQLLSPSTNDALTPTMNVVCEGPLPDLPMLLRMTYSNPVTSSSPPKHSASMFKSKSRPTKRMRQ